MLSDVDVGTQMKKLQEQHARFLVQLGEISAGRQALEGACLAPGNLATLGVLTDPNRGPPVPRQELSQEIR